MAPLKCVIEGLCYPESPRWHAGELWFSDVFLGEIKILDHQGQVRLLARYDGVLSGIGWMPNGDFCAVSVFEHQVLKINEDHFFTWAELDDEESFASNDMIIDASGHAFIGNISFNYMEGEEPRMGNIKQLDIHGNCSTAVNEIGTANGMAISDDGKTLFVAETFSDCLSAFTLNEQGTLSGKWQVTRFPTGSGPDGICLDKQGAIWVACSQSCYVYRVGSQGEYLDRLSLPGGVHPLACVLGGSERKTLFIMTTRIFDPVEAKASLSGAIYCVDVETSGVGRP
ncbi:SMP-30/gluconolactonase/LRE family protein [Shewanella surugensis]|uniref:SMP-30/gluconolactonase/LRE family protein n=1 Tax=Shewanella surugensis TaxID=212020 RepID=A0ABT0LE03_9GAMM|nr:SMP-30/gluconolactonase/LRE family protein [Shewanella surugensis]MCL1125885.1 SMP-30/gluconolactonase/LRE family protein [Shewanella surugensis]